uniref:Amine oxidase domain-containing protein n=1 Tax=Alexandrium catenella TaxID=2925 RepID=A0A7S1S867_ALECA
MHLPADLIEHALKLPSVCYDPTCKDEDVRKEVVWPYAEPLRKVVDFAGRNVGFSAALEAMLGQLRLAGAQLHFDTELIGVHRSTAGWRLQFRSGLSVEVAAAVLNVPRGVLARLDGLPQAAAGRWPAVSCVDRSFPEGLSEGRGTVKVYAIYEEAWWVTRLGLLRGTLEELQTDPPVSIHYHDGEVLCRTSADVSGAPLWKPAREAAERKFCRGVLQVFYRHSQLCPTANPGCMEYWATLPRANASEPLTVVGAESRLAEVLHNKLLAMHMPTFKKMNVSSEGIKLPTVAYSVWTRTGMLPEGDRGLQVSPEDLIFDGRLPEHCGARSVREYQDMVEGIGAWAGAAPRLHFVNNDFSAHSATSWHGPWAEMSLLGAERVLQGAFRLARPAWLNESYYQREVLGAAPRPSAAAGSLLV